MGGSDAVTPVSLAREWDERLDASDKRWIVLEGAAHFPHLEQPERFAAIMRALKQDLLGGAGRGAGALPIPRMGLHCQ